MFRDSGFTLANTGCIDQLLSLLRSCDGLVISSVTFLGSSFAIL